MAAGESEHEKPHNFFAVYLTLFVDSFGARMVLVFVPFFALNLGAQPYQIGWINGAYYFLNSVGVMLWTPLTDFVNTRTILVLCISCLALSYVLFAIADRFWMLVLARGWMGLFAGTQGICVAYVARHATDEQRTGAVSQTQGWMFLGGACGPAIASVLAPFGFSFVCTLSAGLCAVNCMMVLAQLPSETPCQAGGDEAGSNPLRTLSVSMKQQVAFFRTRLKEEPRFAILYSLMFCNSIADGATLSGTFPLLMAYVYNYDAAQLGRVLFVGALFVAAYQSYCVKRLAARFGSVWSYLLGAFARIASYLCVCYWVAPWTPYACSAAALASMTTSSVVITVLLSEMTLPGQHGRTQSASQSFLALGIGLGGPVGGALFQLRPALPFELFSLTTVLTAFMFWRVFGRPVPSPKEEPLLGGA